MLLDEEGKTCALFDGTVDVVEGFHPTAKVDSRGERVAFATLRDGTATVAVGNVRSGADLGSVEVPCGACDDLVTDALDAGVVFIRTTEGTSTWAVGFWALDCEVPSGSCTEPGPLTTDRRRPVVRGRRHVSARPGAGARPAWRAMLPT